MNRLVPISRKTWCCKVQLLRRVAIACLVMLLLAVLVGDVSACPTCKAGLAGHDPVSQARAAGYFYSILFMMAMPFVLIGTFGGAAYLSIRRARQEQDENQPS